MPHSNVPQGDPVQLPLPGLEQQEPLKRGGFTPTVDPSLEALQKIVHLLENISESLDDLCERAAELDEGGYRR